MTKKKKIVFCVAAGLGLLLLCLAAFAYYDFTHNFRIALSPQQISDAQIALKGAMSEAIFNGQQKAEVVPAAELKGRVGLDALFASTPPSNKGEGLIAAYQENPQKFKRYADMLDTAINAKGLRKNNFTQLLESRCSSTRVVWCVCSAEFAPFAAWRSLRLLRISCAVGEHSR
jgi:hypothetical protein